MPPNTVKVTRPGPLGNPFVVSTKVRAGAGCGGSYIAVPTAEDAVECYREMLTLPGPVAEGIRTMLPGLRGKSLACWCAVRAPCHADVLLELANRESDQ